MPNNPVETGDSKQGDSKALNVTDTAALEGVGKQNAPLCLTPRRRAFNEQRVTVLELGTCAKNKGLSRKTVK